MRALLLASLALVALTKPANADTRALSGFDTVNASGNYRVEVTVGEAFGVVVDGADADRIRTRVEGDTLKVEPARRAWFGNPRYDAVVRVTLPRLEGVAAARGIEMSAAAGGPCVAFDAVSAMGSALSVSGLACGAIDAAAAMGAQLTLAGSCDTLKVSAAMGASVRARNLQCQHADISAAMGADVGAFVSGTYDASAAMGGDVSVAGGGRSRDSSAALGGTIRQLN